MWLLIVTVVIVAVMAAVWLARRAKGAHHPDLGPSRTGRVARRGRGGRASTALPADPGDARPAGPDAEAMGSQVPGQSDTFGNQGREPRG